MAVSLLVANSKPAKRLGRPSFRRADPRPEPSLGEDVKKTLRKEQQLKKKKEDNEDAVRLRSWSEIEEWQQQGSDHIQTGYRRATGSVRGCLHSWTFFHNETVNIFSHVLGALIFLAIPTWIVVFSSSSPFSSSFLAEPASLSSSRWHVADTADVLACGAYLAGVATCFVLSTAFHTLMAHSERVYLAGMKLDVQGVLALMWGATAPLLRFLFPGASSRGRDLDQSLDTWCTARHDGHGDDERLRLAYGVVVALLAAACSAATFLPCLSGPRLGPWRAALFGSFAVCSFALPIAHAVVRVGWDEVCARVALRWVGFTAVLNGIGVVVYALKFPERWFPRRFDLVGASHQLMHIFVVAAALTYARAVVLAFDYRHAQDALC